MRRDALAALGVAAALAACGGDADEDGGSVFVEQGRRPRSVAVARCAGAAPLAADPCRRRRYPRTRLVAVVGDPSRSFVVRHHDAGRVEATLHRQRAGALTRVGRFEESLQCADAGGAAALPVRLPPRPGRADTLRILVYSGDDALGAELALPAR